MRMLSVHGCASTQFSDIKTKFSGKLKFTSLGGYNYSVKSACPAGNLLVSSGKFITSSEILLSCKLNGYEISKVDGTLLRPDSLTCGKF